MEKKVCMYGICRDESPAFIARWCRIASQADVAIILDTGSTNKNTIEMITKAYECNKINSFYLYDINPMDFSYARNKALYYSMKYIETNNMIADTDWVFVALDFDEALEDDGIERIREEWDGSLYDCMELVGITQTRVNGLETTTSQSVYYKVHGPRFHWKRRVHEIIELDDRSKTEKDWRIKKTDISYIHGQDKSKNRDYYKLLQLSYIEDGDDSVKNFAYLAWEAYLHNEINEMFLYATKGLAKCENNSSDEFFRDGQYLICLLRFRSLYYGYKEDYDKQYQELKECMIFIETGMFQPVRLILLDIARCAWYIDKNECIKYYHQFFDVNAEEDCWLENYDLYKVESLAMVYDELSTAYYYTDNMFAALLYSKKAMSYNLNNEQIIKNYEFIVNKIENPDTV